MTPAAGYNISNTTQLDSIGFPQLLCTSWHNPGHDNVIGDYWHLLWLLILMMGCVWLQSQAGRVALTRLGSSLLLAFLDISASLHPQQHQEYKLQLLKLKEYKQKIKGKTFYLSGSLSMGNALKSALFLCRQWNPLFPIFVHCKSQSVLCSESTRLEMLQLCGGDITFGCSCSFLSWWYLWFMR